MTRRISNRLLFGICIASKPLQISVFCIFSIRFSVLFTLAQWIGVLAISTKYYITPGVQAALTILRNPSGSIRFPPCFKLRLAWQYQVEDWYDECLKDIMCLPPAVFDCDDLRDLEEPITVLVTEIFEHIRKHRLELIPYVPEPKHTATCLDPGRCARDWSLSYSSAMLLFAHTRHYYSGREVYDKLRKIEVHTVHESCRTLTLQDIKDRGVLWKEEDILEKGVEALRKLLTTTRPSHPRPPARFVDKNSLRARNDFYAIY